VNECKPLVSGDVAISVYHWTGYQDRDQVGNGTTQIGPLYQLITRKA